MTQRNVSQMLAALISPVLCLHLHERVSVSCGLIGVTNGEVVFYSARDRCWPPNNRTESSLLTAVRCPELQQVWDQEALSQFAGVSLRRETW